MNVYLSLPQRYKRILQAMTITIPIIYMTLIFYENTHGYSTVKNIERRSGKSPNNQDNNIFYLIKTKFINPINENLTTLLIDKNENISTNLLHQRATVIIRKDIFNFNFTTTEEGDNNNERIGSNGKAGGRHHRPTMPAINSMTTTLDDIFISIKTTKNNHDTRLALIINTWFQLAKEQTWFFTDTNDKFYQEKTNGHLINTNCSIGHFRKALCCKMSAELDAFLESGKKWFCHFDDDNYVNIPRLVNLLDEYNPYLDWYLGKPSISSPLEIHFKEKNSSTTSKRKISFWFATGGAGFCLSRALTLRMFPIAGDGKFINIAEKIRFPDDVTMGFIIEHLLKVPLTVLNNFHSHLEPMEFIRPETFHDQISFSYARIKNEWNVVNVNGFDTKTDPKRFYSLHCHLFPDFNFCHR